MRLIDADELLTDNTWTWFDEWGNREVYLDVRVKPWSIDEVYGNVCIQLDRER